MTTDWKNAITRESILALLTDAEVAKISAAEGAPRIIEGDEYVDIEDLAAGVQQAHAVPRAKASHVITRSAVSDATWTKIVRAMT
jgi:hypothetical protein